MIEIETTIFMNISLKYAPRPNVFYRYPRRPQKKRSFSYVV